MKKERFKEIVNNYSSTLDEVNSLKKLANDYPFSQIIHLLLANASKKNNTKDFKPSLRNAAFHSTDRSILKSLIENNLVPSEEPKAANLAAVIPDSKSSFNKKDILPTRSQINTDDLIAEVLENLEKLQKTKKETAILFEDSPVVKEKKKKAVVKKITRKPKVTKQVPKVKSQTNIIEKFIKEEPSITKNTKPMNEKADMASSSGKMRDDVISESLAKIFAKQGKIDKAIDIYKKLIWKLPQKKALFAAEIEKLKKK